MYGLGHILYSSGFLGCITMYGSIQNWRIEEQLLELERLKLQWLRDTGVGLNITMKLRKEKHFQLHLNLLIQVKIIWKVYWLTLGCFHHRSRHLHGLHSTGYSSLVTSLTPESVPNGDIFGTAKNLTCNPVLERLSGELNRSNHQTATTIPYYHNLYLLKTTDFHICMQTMSLECSQAEPSASSAGQ